MIHALHVQEKRVKKQLLDRYLFLFLFRMNMNMNHQLGFSLETLFSIKRENEKIILITIKVRLANKF